MRLLGQRAAGLTQVGPAPSDPAVEVFELRPAKEMWVVGRTAGEAFSARYDPRTRGFAERPALTPVDRAHAHSLGAALGAALDLVVCSGNRDKLSAHHRIADQLGVSVQSVAEAMERVGLDPSKYALDPIEDNQVPSNDSRSVVENAAIKAMSWAAVLEHLGLAKTAVADDYGVSFAALDGFPGADFKPAAQEVRELVIRRARGERLDASRLEHPYLAVLLPHLGGLARDVAPLLPALDRGERPPSLHYESVFVRAMAAFLEAHPEKSRELTLLGAISEKSPDAACRTRLAKVPVRLAHAPTGTAEFPLDAWVETERGPLCALSPRDREAFDPRHRALAQLYAAAKPTVAPAKGEVA